MKRFINDFKKHFAYAKFSAKSELKAEIANSYLNWIWWILEPFCFMLIYAFVFTYVFNAREDYFPIFIFIGITNWDFFNKNIMQSIKLLKKNKSIISKVYIPKFVIVVSKMFVNGFKMFISFGIVLVMMIFYRVPVDYHLLYFFPLLVIYWILTFGCMCLMFHFGVFVTDLSNVMKLFFRMLFYVTGIFYDVEHRLGRVNMELAHLVERANPVAFILKSMRQCLIYKTSPDLRFMLLWLVIGILLSVLGVHTIYKYENGYAKVV